jgi:hypothetical protein
MSDAVSSSSCRALTMCFFEAPWRNLAPQKKNWEDYRVTGGTKYIAGGKKKKKKKKKWQIGA